MIAVLHKDAKSANGSSYEILRAIEGLRNQTYNLLAEARVISGKQSSTPTTPPSTVLKNQDIPKKEDVSKDEDVLMADHCPQMDGVPTLPKAIP